jgi:threonyl-tRNA synthetase
MTIQGEFERMRSMRLDDAMLIEKLRSSQSEIQDTMNEIIGVLTAFGHHLEGLSNRDHLTDALHEII